MLPSGALVDIQVFKTMQSIYWNRLLLTSSLDSPQHFRAFRWQKNHLRTHECVVHERGNELTAHTQKNNDSFFRIHVSFIIALNAEIILINQFSLFSGKKTSTVHLAVSKSYHRICYSAVVVLCRIHSDRSPRYFDSLSSEDSQPLLFDIRLCLLMIKNSHVIMCKLPTRKQKKIIYSTMNTFLAG